LITRSITNNRRPQKKIIRVRDMLGVPTKDAADS
jgi:hypothetical protein